MSLLEAKKYDLITWIISIADERVLDDLRDAKTRMEATVPTPPVPELRTLTYSELQSRKVDIESLKEEQQYRPLSRQELDRIAEMADIQEPIEDLLGQLKHIG